MVRVETRPLTADEEKQILDEAGAGPSAFETGCLLFGGLVVGPALGYLVADNLLAWRGGGAPWIGAVAGLLAGAAWTAGPLALMGRGSRDGLRGMRRRELEAGPVERWTVEASRAWDVDCRGGRALLLEADGRLVVVASRHLEHVPLGSYPARLEMDVLPQLERVLSLSPSAELRDTQPVTLTLDELGQAYPLKKRRFRELWPDGLSPATLERLGLGTTFSAPRAAADSAATLPLERAVEWNDDVDLLQRLVPPAARLVRQVLLWMVPALAVLGLATRRVHGAPDGAVPSLLLLFVLAWFLCVLAAEAWRFWAALRVLRHGHGPLVHLEGLARADRTFEAPLTGRPAVMARASLLLGARGLLQGVPFVVETPDGARHAVDVEHAWLLREGDTTRVARVATADAERMVGGPGDSAWHRAARWQFPLETVVADGGRVHVLGTRSAPDRIAGSAAQPVLLWTPGGEPRRFTL